MSDDDTPIPAVDQALYTLKSYVYDYVHDLGLAQAEIKRVEAERDALLFRVARAEVGEAAALEQRDELRARLALVENTAAQLADEKHMAEQRLAEAERRIASLHHGFRSVTGHDVPAWIDAGTAEQPRGSSDEPVCDECGGPVDGGLCKKCDYCPKCGSLMEAVDGRLYCEVCAAREDGDPEHIAAMEAQWMTPKQPRGSSQVAAIVPQKTRIELSCVECERPVYWRILETGESAATLADDIRESFHVHFSKWHASEEQPRGDDGDAGVV